MKYTSIVEEDIKNIVNDFGLNELLEKLCNKTVLITGASGMLGSYFTYVMLYLNDLFNANIKLKLVVRNISKLDDYVKNSNNVAIIIQDVTNDIFVSGDINYIIHAASPASPILMSKFPVETNLANTLGTANTLKLAKEKNVDGYLFISSREIYGEPIEGQTLFKEDGLLGQVNPLVPRNGYAEGKKAAENLCSAYNEQYQLNTKIARLAHTYGPGMSVNDGRVQADFLKNVLNNENIVLKSDGSSIRTYTYVSDAILAMLLILLKSKDIVYNVSDENSITSIRQLAQTMVNINPNKNLQLVFNISDQNQKGCASFKTGILSSEKIRKELKWNPRYSIPEGFKRTLFHLEEELEMNKNNKQTYR